MAGIDASRPFHPLHIAVLTVSDSRTDADDRSGRTLVERATEAGHVVVTKRIVPDRRDSIVDQLRAWADDPGIEVVITTGGTGVTERDVTPEAVEEVCEKLVPGFGELFRQISYELIGTSTLQSRATAGVVRGTYVFALPGSTGACRDGWDHILQYQLDIRHRPCNFAELLPRLRGDRSPRHEPLVRADVEGASEHWGAALAGRPDVALSAYDASSIEVVGPTGERCTTRDAVAVLLESLLDGITDARRDERAGGLQPGGLVWRSTERWTLSGDRGHRGYTVVTEWHRRGGDVRIRSQAWIPVPPKSG